MTSTAPSTNRAVLLPETYQPCPNTVIIGRGQQVQDHPGNRRLQELLKACLTQYEAATTRDLKSDAIGRVLQNITQFVKQDRETGRWIALPDVAARQATGQAFRDLLQGKYRSSKQSKQAKRAMQKSATPFAESMNLPRVVSAEGASALSISNSSSRATSDDDDTACFDRLYSLLNMEEKAVSQGAGNPFEPTPLRDHNRVTSSSSPPMPVQSPVAALSPLQQFLAKRQAATAQSRSYLKILEQQQRATLVPVGRGSSIAALYFKIHLYPSSIVL